MSNLDDLRTLAVEEVAQILGVRPEAVRIWIREGLLRAMKWGRRFHVRPEDLRVQELPPAWAAIISERSASCRSGR